MLGGLSILPSPYSDSLFIPEFAKITRRNMVVVADARLRFMPQEPLVITEASGQADGEEFCTSLGILLTISWLQDSCGRYLAQVSGERVCLVTLLRSACWWLSQPPAARPGAGSGCGHGARRTTLHVLRWRQLFQFYGSIAEVRALNPAGSLRYISKNASVRIREAFNSSSVFLLTASC